MRARVETSGPVNLEQLSAEVGAGLCAGDGVVVAADGTDVTQAELEAAVAAHVPDPQWGMTDREKQLEAVRQKARDVWSGSDTFTAAQVQKLLAGLVLRELGEM